MSVYVHDRKSSQNIFQRHFELYNKKGLLFLSREGGNAVTSSGISPDSGWPRAEIEGKLDKASTHVNSHEVPDAVSAMAVVQHQAVGCRGFQR